ncbi:transglycosylase family protein [Salsipaludibacter albus]|uniref:transglycosylase family protein n=1 Tax=Salsipaludibacter albus TaxID=2849650 RepID=UPI001EE482E4|nr:LysM peptidoglycan-binding domain-containing protein [Salsipaludibacter albus]
MAAATVSAVALGGLSTAASADSNWDRLAECESGQTWDIDTGNGYYGGLQFAKSSWDAAGGEQYAEYPHQASRSEQIAAAETLLDMQGAGAWPACTAKLGLSTADLSGSAEAAPSADQSDDSDDQSDESSNEQSSDSDDDADDSSSDDTVAVETDGTYTVERGDTLASIAARLGVDGGWRTLYEANADAIGTPGLIFTGQELALPASANDRAAEEADLGESSGTYRVQAGDSLAEIAREYSLAGGWPSLYDANDDAIANPNLIVTGQVLDLP